MASSEGTSEQASIAFPIEEIQTKRMEKHPSLVRRRTAQLEIEPQSDETTAPLPMVIHRDSTPLNIESEEGNPDESLPSGDASDMLQSILLGMKHFFVNYTNLLFAPALIALIVNMAKPFNVVVVFVCSLALVGRLAYMISYLTDQLAHYVSPMIAGLINASFGNVTELAVAIISGVKCEFELLTLSLLGSIWSNFLLVFGTSIFSGGLKYSVQKISRTVVQSMSMPLYVMVVMMALDRAVYDFLAANSKDLQQAETKGLLFQRITSLAKMVVYGIYIAFTGYTHAYQLGGANSPPTVEVCGVSLLRVTVEQSAAPLPQEAEPKLEMNPEMGPENEPQGPKMAVAPIIVCLIICTGATYIAGEALVDTLSGFSHKLHLTTLMTMLILLPVAGNATEHWSAIKSALDNEIDQSAGCAIGSVLQINFLVIPAVVCLCWALNLPYIFILAWWQIIGTSVSIGFSTFMPEETNYFHGVLLLLMYFVLTLLTCILPMAPLPSFFCRHHH